jgi:hypothetical protein
MFALGALIREIASRLANSNNKSKGIKYALLSGKLHFANLSVRLIAFGSRSTHNRIFGNRHGVLAF